MRISELIAHLQSLQSEHGDLECETTFSYGRDTLLSPVIAYRKKSASGRLAFWFPGDGESRKGDKVVRF